MEVWVEGLALPGDLQVGPGEQVTCESPRGARQDRAGAPRTDEGITLVKEEVKTVSILE